MGLKQGLARSGGAIAAVTAGLAASSIAVAGHDAICPIPSCPTTTHADTTIRSFPTLTLAPTVVDFGASVKLSGVVRGAHAGVDVQILSQPCGFTTPVQSGATKTRSDGSYTFSMSPTRSATLYARSSTRPSPGRIVGVRPGVTVTRAGSSKFTVEVSAGAGDFFTGAVQLQSYVARGKSWHRVASSTLRRQSEATAIVAVSGATIQAHVKAGTTLRAWVGKSTVGACYRAASSAPTTA